MEEKVIFTICAKNYLAQALSLKRSVKETNPGADFYIFISDDKTGVEDQDFMFLDDSWIPGWKKMAFKYNVIEFSTSIKPFCIEYLFKKYRKVVYLDPDIYVTDRLDVVFDALDHKDVMISPHYCEMEEQFSGAVSEEEILFVGIYNLGFLAIKNSETGQRITKWWMNRLADKCYADKADALHVDQKWFDFIPAYFPDNVLISHHFGINTAIWNLHERELIIKDEKYFVVNKITKTVFPMLFFHFSGFNPKNPRVINRRHPKYNVETFPSFDGLFRVYTNLVLANDFERYTILPYGFNAFENSEKITPLQRRLFRQIESKINCDDPFTPEAGFYKILKESKLLTGVKIQGARESNPNIRHDRNSEVKMGIQFLRGLKRIIGIRYYNYLLSFFAEYHRLDLQTILISEKAIEKFKNK